MKCRRCDQEKRLVKVEGQPEGYCEDCFTEVVIGEAPNEAPELRYDLSDDVR